MPDVRTRNELKGCSHRTAAAIRANRMPRASSLIGLFLAVHCLVFGMRANADGEKMGKLEGTVSTGETASLSYVPGARVQASGPVTIQTEADAEGKFVFGEMPAGSYTLTAT